MFCKVLSPRLKLSRLVANGFSNQPIATCTSKFGGSSISQIMTGACCLRLSNSFWAVALTYAPESTKAFLFGHSWFPGSTKSLSFLRFRTFVEDIVRYISLVYSSLVTFSSVCGDVPVKGGILLSPFNVVNVCLCVLEGRFEKCSNGWGTLLKVSQLEFLGVVPKRFQNLEVGVPLLVTSELPRHIATCFQIVVSREWFHLQIQNENYLNFGSCQTSAARQPRKTQEVLLSWRSLVCQVQYRSGDMAFQE